MADKKLGLPGEQERGSLSRVIQLQGKPLSVKGEFLEGLLLLLINMHLLMRRMKKVNFPGLVRVELCYSVYQGSDGE